MTNTQRIRRWFEEVWNQEREATIDELCSKDAIGYGQTSDGSPIRGPENFKVFWKEFRRAFSAIHIEIHRSVEQGDLVLAQWTVTMKHTGPFMGKSTTGKQITATGMSLQRFADGKIIEAWDNYDQLGILVQLGLVDGHALGQTKNPLRATG
jgi:steroid delta-isomerase-like uncharacterized protein